MENIGEENITGSIEPFVGLVIISKYDTNCFAETF